MRGRRTFRDYITLMFKGVAMGTANKIPGVSGGTVALITGFYEELIYSTQKFNGKSLMLLRKRGFAKFAEYTNAYFLISVFGGSILSFFSISLILDYLIKHYETYVWGYFFGLILGSIYSVYDDLKERSVSNYLMILLGTVVGAIISFLPVGSQNDALWFVLLCGMISVSGMTLPGLSGSFIVMLLGNYVLLIVDSVNALSLSVVDVFSGDFSFLSDPDRMGLLKVLLFFTLGSIIGLVFFSHLLSYLLKNFHQKVLSVLLGFITGSLGIVWPWKQTIYHEGMLDSKGQKMVHFYERYLPTLSDFSTFITLFYIVLGTFTVVYLHRNGIRKTQTNTKKDV